jgi:hypothetical protein
LESSFCPFHPSTRTDANSEYGRAPYATARRRIGTRRAKGWKEEREIPAEVADVEGEAAAWAVATAFEFDTGTAEAGEAEAKMETGGVVEEEGAYGAVELGEIESQYASKAAHRECQHEVTR